MVKDPGLLNVIVSYKLLLLATLHHGTLIPLRRCIVFSQNRSFRLRNSMRSRIESFCCCNFCPLSFVRRHGTSAMVPSPLCGRIVTFEIYPRKNHGKNVRGPPAATRSLTGAVWPPPGRPLCAFAPCHPLRCDTSVVSLGVSWAQFRTPGVDSGISHPLPEVTHVPP